MGWNNDETLLTAPISIGDVSKACHINSLDLGKCIERAAVNGTINAMAKYKPVKLNVPVRLTVTQRASVRYGLSEPSTFEPGRDNGTLPPAWTYQCPTAGGPNEWFRALDFDGYDPYAVQPLAITVYNFGIRKMVKVIVWKDGGVNNYYTIKGDTSRRQWHSDQSLSVNEILSGGSQYQNHKIAFCIYNTNPSHKGVNLIVTNKTFADLANTEELIFDLNGGDTKTDSDVTYPKIPILYDTTYSGDEYVVVVCLHTGTVTSGNAYNVIVPSDQVCYSLGFDAGNLTDRVTMLAESGYDLSNITASNLSVTKTSSASYDSTFMRCNISNASVTLTSNANWDGTTINLELILDSSDSAIVYDGTQIVGTATVTEQKAISKNESKSVTITISNLSYLVPKSAGSGNAHARFSLYGYYGQNSQNKLLLATHSLALTW